MGKTVYVVRRRGLIEVFGSSERAGERLRELTESSVVISRESTIERLMRHQIGYGRIGSHALHGDLIVISGLDVLKNSVTLHREPLR